MSEQTVVAVTCDHRGKGEWWEGEAETTIGRWVVTPGREPKGFDLSGRVLIGKKVLSGDSMATKWRALWNAATETGVLPRVAHDLRCECGHDRRLPDLELRRALTRLAEAGMDSVQLRSLPRKM